MIRTLLSKLFAPRAPVFVITDPDQAKRESRAATLRAQIEREAAHLDAERYTDIKRYGEHLIGQVNRDEVSLGGAYALIHGYISRRTHTLAPLPALRPLSNVRG